MATIWTKVGKPSTSWTKVSLPANELKTVAGMPIGLLLALTYSQTNVVVNGWTKVAKAVGTVWTKVLKAT